jgi:hypothetical protein
MNFAERLAGLPATDHLARLELSGPEGQAETIENRPGSAGSVRVYAHLAARHGSIIEAAAREGVEIYAEHSEDARLHPGKHPNIDRLFAVLDGGGPWQVRAIPKAQ